MTVQISFLGKASVDTTTGYRIARYRLDNTKVVETPFFGLELARHLKPSRFILLGTPGSMWDVLLESSVGDAAAEAARLELQDRAISETVDESLLGQFEPFISEHVGVPCELRVISYGQNDVEQAGMIEHLTEWLNPNEEVVLDVTHGLRHLPMLMLAAAHYLEKVRRVKVSEIFYAALELTPKTHNAETPVLRLSGLLRMLDWVQALAAYDKDGDYGVFSELLTDTGVQGGVGNLLRQAAFMERTSRDGRSRGFVKQAVGDLSRQPLIGMAALFDKPLRERLDWINENRMFERQRKLARIYLERGDFIRASIYAFEAFITRLVQQQGRDPQNFENRQQAREDYQNENPSSNYRLLRDLRNALAHGVPSTRREVQQAMSDEGSLRNTLSSLIGQLLDRST